MRDYPSIYLEELRKPTKTSVKIDGILAKIWIQHILNISLKYYQYTNHLSVNLWAWNKCYLLYDL
jgi:hypothetical protein